MNNFLKTESEITSWLDAMNVKKYTLLPHETYGFIVNVEAGVNLNQENLTSIPIKFGTVLGSFSCNHNHLTSLLGAPDVVEYAFECQGNQLTSLEHAPKTVGYYFNCSGNHLTTLQGAPLKIHHSFNCADNHLTSLEGCPTDVKTNFNCTNNQLNTLEFFPQHVGGSFFVQNNPSLALSSDVYRFDDIFKIHQEIVNIKQEKKDLESVLDSDGLKIHPVIQHKI